MLKINVLYFASIQEKLGPGEVLNLPWGTVIADARSHLIASSRPHAEALGQTQLIRCALNQVLCDETALLHDGAELAFFPPVTGG
jgi:sulfur-carrier protein